MDKHRRKPPIMKFGFESSRSLACLAALIPAVGTACSADDSDIADGAGAPDGSPTRDLSRSTSRRLRVGLVISWSMRSASVQIE